MKKLLFVLGMLIIGLTSNLLKAQTGWVQTQLGSVSNGYNLYATDTEIYAATANGIYSTTDNGMPWFSKGTPHVFYDIIKSHQYLLAVSSDGVYRSSDNGSSWQQRNGLTFNLKSASPHLFAKNSSYVFALSGLELLRSGDDGETWQPKWLGQDAPGYQDYAASANSICTVGEKIFINCGGLYGNYFRYTISSSTDNGDTWVGSDNIFIRDSISVRAEYLFTANDNLYASNSNGLYLSTDLGNSWTVIYSNTFDQHGELIGEGIFRDMVSYNGNLIGLAGATSIRISRDGGTNWADFSDGMMPGWFFSALAIKPPYIWAIRYAFANTYRRSLTEIVGQSEWTVRNSGITTSLHCVKAVNQYIVWAVGDYGKVLKTTNGGQNWNPADGGAMGTDQVFTIDALDLNTAFVGTYSSSGTTKIYRTTNSGTTWAQVFSQQGGFINGIKMYDANNGIACGDPVDGKWTLLKTTDAGLTWSRIATEPAQLNSEFGYTNSFTTFGESNIWFGTNSNKIYHSTDGGMTWSYGTCPNTNIYGIAFTNALFGLAGSDSGYIIQTTDGGATWSYKTQLEASNISGFCAFQNDFFCSLGNKIYRSMDNGTTWTESFNGASPINYLSSQVIGSVLTVWAVDYNGNIVSYSGTITDVKDHRPNISTGFKLQQNYPNPFNPSTTINYSVPLTSFVTIKVYDVLGKEVADLVKENKPVGNYSVEFNASKLVSGIYFYQLKTNKFVETKKLILLK